MDHLKRLLFFVLIFCLPSLAHADGAIYTPGSYPDIVGLWTAPCTGYLKHDGTCSVFNLVDDTTPQLGGDLDGQTYAVTTTGKITGGVYTISVSSSCTIGSDCDTTLTKVAYDGVIYVTSAATVTLPAVGSGMAVVVTTVGAIAVSVDANASDKIWLDGTALDDGDKITNTSTAGDTAVCTYYSADGWYCKTTGWTDGGA